MDSCCIWQMKHLDALVRFGKRLHTFAILFSRMFKYTFTCSVKWKLESSNVLDSLVSNNLYARVGGEPYSLNRIEYCHQTGTFIWNNRNSFDTIRPISRSFNRSLCASLARISNDVWWSWHLFYWCWTTDWRLGKGTFSMSFLPFTLFSKYMRNNVYFHSILDNGLWIIPSLWPIVSHLNPKSLCEMASPP